jgi:hypothetical protein
MRDLKIINRWLLFFIVVLFISGFTAMPVETGLGYLCTYISPGNIVGNWLHTVYNAVKEMNVKYPFLSYGYDWLAFAHYLFAILFIGPYKNPIKNKWIIEFGIIACLLIIPFALIAGHIRHIPFWWRLIDCSFGIIGLLPLYICLKKIKQLELNTLNK